MDPHQLYQIDPTSLATSPVFPTSSPIDESPMAQTPQEQRVPTLAQIIEMKETLQKVLTKVEMLEQRKPAQRSNDAIGTNATDERISLLTGQMEKMAGEQAAYLASIQQGMIGILSAQQHATAERTKMAESSRSFQEQIIQQVETHHQHYQQVLLNHLSCMQTKTHKRLDDLELKLTSENQRINDLEMQIYSKIESVERNNQQFAMMLANVQECTGQIKRISEALNTEFAKMTSEVSVRRQGSTPDKSGITRFFSGCAPSSSQVENAKKLKMENERLRQQIHGMSNELHRTHSSLKKMREEKESLKCAVMKVKGEIEGTWAGRKTVSEVTLEYEKLFTNHCKRLRTALKESKRPTDLLVNKIFQKSYLECRSAVLKELLRELFIHHGPDDEDMAVAEAQMRLYGQLLGLKHQQLSSTFADCSGLTFKVLQRIGIKEVNRDDPLSDPRYWFTQEAVKTALNMIIMQPPMVVEYPHKFISDWDAQEKQPGAWDETLQEGEYELEYFRPVLYSNYHAQEIIKPALVGNKPKSTDY